MFRLLKSNLKLKMRFPVLLNFYIADPKPVLYPKGSADKKEAKSVRRRTAVSQRNFVCTLSQGLCTDWLVCIAYCIFWDLIGSDQLSYFP